VPFFVSGPGVAGGGRVSRAFATAMDVPATILDLAGVEHPAEWRGKAIAPMLGRSMRAHLADEAAAVHPSGFEAGWELFGRRAIRRDSYKAIWLRSPEGEGRWQLYDLDADPGEIDDLTEQRPAILAELVSAWNRYAAQAGIVDVPASVFEMDDMDG